MLINYICVSYSDSWSIFVCLVSSPFVRAFYFCNMYALLKLAENARNLTSGKIFVLTFDRPELKTLVVKLNRDQLRVSRLSNDQEIPFVYSDRSIEQFGKSPGRWTLFDTGDLYDSFTVTAVTEEAIIEFGDLEKDGGARDFDSLFNGNVLGLDTESKSILIDEALPVMRDALLAELLKGI